MKKSGHNELPIVLQTIVESKDIAKIEMFPGFWRQTLVYGESLMYCLFTWKKGAILPKHFHFHEQAGYIIYGSVELNINDQIYITSTGCSNFIASNQRHSARALNDSLVIDAFSPPRLEYIEI